LDTTFRNDKLTDLLEAQVNQLQVNCFCSELPSNKIWAYCQIAKHFIFNF